MGLASSYTGSLVATPSTVVTLIRLYPLHCKLYFCTLTRWQLPAGRSLLPLKVTFVVPFTVYTPFVNVL
jgi:hypothetical protein